MTIKINPHPSSLPPQKLDEMLDGELTGFEKWFRDKQQQAGRSPHPLIGVEKAAIKTYLMYLATKDD